MPDIIMLDNETLIDIARQGYNAVVTAVEGLVGIEQSGFDCWEKLSAEEQQNNVGIACAVMESALTVRREIKANALDAVSRDRRIFMMDAFIEGVGKALVNLDHPGVQELIGGTMAERIKGKGDT